MRRREFITLLGGAAALPLAARAQQTARVPRLVFLHGRAEDDSEEQARIVAFRQGLEALGWTANRNIRIEHQFSAGDLARIQILTAGVVSSPPDLIVASGTPIVAALKQATSTIPIVFSVVGDPLGQGFVDSLARPGRNITGFSYVDFAMIGKWLEMLTEIAPGLKRITLMFDPQTAPWYSRFLREFGASAGSLTALSEIPVRDAAEIEAAIVAFARDPGGGVIVGPDPFTNTHRKLIMALVERHRLPAIYGFRQFVTEGALISYAPDAIEIVRRSASYVDRILKGEKPADLPVQAPTKYELVINLKTAKALGLDRAAVAARPRRRGDRMKRREFIAALGGAAALPLAARAQQATACGASAFSSSAADDPNQARSEAFLQGLQEMGWTDGRNVRIDYRWASDESSQYAAELVALAPDVILANAHPCKRRCRSDPHVPIVFVAAAIRSAPAWSKAWPDRAATPPVSRIRIQHEREMAGATQGNLAQCDASGGTSGSPPAPASASLPPSRLWRRR